MQSTDREHFFETDASQAQRERKAAKADNKNGDPLVMKSKILAAIEDPDLRNRDFRYIYIAESAGFVRRIDMKSRETKATYRGPSAPVTSVAVGGKEWGTVFAGCWDKDIWCWDVSSTQLLRKYSGHTDFVKTVLCTTISGKHILISGGADKKIIVWDIETGRRLHTLQDPTTTMLAVQHLALEPVLSTPDEAVIVSASSDPDIRRWKIGLDRAEQMPESFHDRAEERLTIGEHDTSVYKLFFDDLDDDLDLWTASADGTAKCLSRARNFVTEDTFTHGDYVKAVVVTSEWVVTAGRDENIKVWDRTSGKLYCTLEGHFEEVTDLVLKGTTLYSVSIDRTIRTWPLDKPALDKLITQIEEQKSRTEPMEEAKNVESMLTAEEEAELAELMDD